MNEPARALWNQFGAAIDALDDAMVACPGELWHERLWGDPPDFHAPAGFAEFWYVAYHTLFWIDLYLFGTGDGFVPHSPFTDDELDPAGKVPDVPYSIEDLREFLRYVREASRSTFASMSEAEWQRPCAFPWTRGKMVSYFELQLYNMRHIQEHVAQLNLFLGQQQPGTAAGWVARARA